MTCNSTIGRTLSDPGELSVVGMKDVYASTTAIGKLCEQLGFETLLMTRHCFGVLGDVFFLSCHIPLIERS